MSGKITRKMIPLWKSNPLRLWDWRWLSILKDLRVRLLRKWIKRKVHCCNRKQLEDFPWHSFPCGQSFEARMIKIKANDCQSQGINIWWICNCICGSGRRESWQGSRKQWQFGQQPYPWGHRSGKSNRSTAQACHQLHQEFQNQTSNHMLYTISHWKYWTSSVLPWIK